MRKIQVSAIGAAVVLVVSLVWGIGLLGSDVKVESASGQSESCGSAFTVTRQGNAYYGGELRSDQANFNSRCVSNAHEKVYMAAVPAGVALAAATILVVGLRSEHRRARRGRELAQITHH